MKCERREQPCPYPMNPMAISPMSMCPMMNPMMSPYMMESGSPYLNPTTQSEE